MRSPPLVHRLSPGFGITEALVALGLLGIIILSMSSFLETSVKTQRGIQAKDQQREVTSDVRSLLADSDACKASFQGQSPQSNATALKDASGAVRFAINTPDKTKLLEFKGFKLINWTPDATNPNEGRSDLVITLARQGSTNSTQYLKPDLIGLKMYLDTSGNISDCHAFLGGSASGTSFWKASPGNPSNIFYDGGNVGIGHDSPQQQLDLSGAIKIGNSSSTCDASKEGSLRYNSTLKGMEFCDGSDWFSVMPTIKRVTRSCRCSPTSNTWCFFCHTASQPWAAEVEVSCPYGFRAIAGSASNVSRFNVVSFSVNSFGTRCKAFHTHAPGSSAFMVGVDCTAICIKGNIRFE